MICFGSDGCLASFSLSYRIVSHSGMYSALSNDSTHLLHANRVGDSLFAAAPASNERSYNLISTSLTPTATTFALQNNALAFASIPSTSITSVFNSHRIHMTHKNVFRSHTSAVMQPHTLLELALAAHTTADCFSRIHRQQDLGARPRPLHRYAGERLPAHVQLRRLDGKEHGLASAELHPVKH